MDMDARREIGKWLNEQPSREIDRRALAELCAEYDRMRQGDTCARMCEGTAYRTELQRLRAAVRTVMPANWEEDPDWVILAEGHNLVPNIQDQPGRTG